MYINMNSRRIDFVGYSSWMSKVWKLKFLLISDPQLSCSVCVPVSGNCGGVFFQGVLTMVFYQTLLYVFFFSPSFLLLSFFPIFLMFFPSLLLLPNSHFSFPLYTLFVCMCGVIRDMHAQIISSIKNLQLDGEDPRKLLQSWGRLRFPRHVLQWVCRQTWCQSFSRQLRQNMLLLKLCFSFPRVQCRLVQHKLTWIVITVSVTATSLNGSCDLIQ